MGYHVDFLVCGTATDSKRRRRRRKAEAVSDRGVLLCVRRGFLGSRVSSDMVGFYGLPGSSSVYVSVDGDFGGCCCCC